jgi:pimeloyl-ACP methyl ester carboxylesterase
MKRRKYAMTNPVLMDRRDVIRMSSAGLVLAAMTEAAPAAAQTQTPRIEAEEHWVMKGPVKLYVYRKRQVEGGGTSTKPVLFLVHGSTFSSRGSFDLVVPGKTGYSAMDHFTGLGYDVWTMDHEGYGFSDRTESNSGILSGVEDLKAALPLIEKVTGKPSVIMFGASSGAIRAGAFANAAPERVERLILHAFTYTGENAPEIERRRKQVDTYRQNPRRPLGMQQIQNVFDRDVAGKADPALINALADFEKQFGGTTPTGTYLDMAVNMPMVDPAKLNCPVCLIRPEHDGNASEEELYSFFEKLATKDKQFVMLRGMTHGGGMIGRQRERLWHVIQAFLTCPVA